MRDMSTNDKLSAKPADREGGPYAAENMPTGKVFMASRYLNQISHRQLNKFELRNAAMTLRSASLHDTWDEAHAAILQQREQDLKDAESKLVRARAALKRAHAMRRKEPKA